MNNDNEKIFDIFYKSKTNYQAYEATKEYVEKRLYEECAKENVRFYSIITKLQNSINSAGWEKRHSEQIEFMTDICRDIEDEYEEFLP